ncbi:peptide-methionine (R)-S-oxide reductase MsrB [Methanomassiliicoccus luminyensis]|jgi:peptide-methionine (R)-S-oxide reductase|uniref:peptide-methionine (R)-S-oxide reductase MsrB n=1 Tax=Methanomassiliicoccus luminyensis TaxID=1080712 RepID=UPI00035D8613|nr:peptide-methionine (R)-S-oxide reductase MsrB [Methanomassiliicoccus luminyensis]
MASKNVGNVEKLVRSEEEWKRILPSDKYRILRQGGTEPAFHNEYWDEHRAGTYVCGGCGLPLFSSDAKFDSGTGWPSFFAPIAPQNVETAEDVRYGMMRTEVKCVRCGGHLGHLFDDGPRPTGLRYCMNSGSLDFRPEK